MKIIDKIKSRLSVRSRFQDVMFLIVIFVFSTILFLGLFPGSEKPVGGGSSFYLYAMGMVPIIVAIYFIIISFRRNLFSGFSEIGSSIRLKIALAFVFVAILPSLPIILVSNNIINQTISKLIAEKTSEALEESINMSHDTILKSRDGLLAEVQSLDYSLRGGMLSLENPESRRYLMAIARMKGYGVVFYRAAPAQGGYNVLAEMERSVPNDPSGRGIARFLSAVNLTDGPRIYNISTAGSPILLARLYAGGYLVALYSRIPEKIFRSINLYEESLRSYKQMEFLKPYFQTGTGILLLILSILIIVISMGVSFLLAKNITRPVLELVEAANMVARGDFSVRLERDSSDEMGLLFRSFNDMALQLDEGRKIMFQTQKLEAWREIARKLVHEIKNPLTPIRLSAERIQRRYREGHPEIEAIVLTGTETIIDEVNVLMKLLGEFSRFARLPEMKPEYNDLNAKIENCVNFFSGHEGINFTMELDPAIPEMFIDRILIRQALTNIIQNAVDSVGRRGTIDVRSEWVGDAKPPFARISVRDDGKGVRAEDMERIFDPTFSTKEHGTGLGLAIVSKIILEHHGKISCRSEEGKGAEFFIELPITPQGEESHG